MPTLIFEKFRQNFSPLKQEKNDLNLYHLENYSPKESTKKEVCTHAKGCRQKKKKNWRFFLRDGSHVYLCLWLFFETPYFSKKKKTNSNERPDEIHHFEMLKVNKNLLQITRGFTNPYILTNRRFPPYRKKKQKLFV